jgi:hypothetical protein
MAKTDDPISLTFLFKGSRLMKGRMNEVEKGRKN